MTIRIRISGWNPGLKKVSLNHLLQDDVGYSLSTAKRVVDDILDGKPVEIDVADERAAKFVEKAGRLGAIAVILSTTDDATETP